MTTSSPAPPVSLPRQDSLGVVGSTSTNASLFSNGTTANGSQDDFHAQSPSEQLEALHKKLDVLRKVEAGAESIITTDEVNNNKVFRDELRAELESARKAIEDTQRQIERIQASMTKPPAGRNKSNSGASSMKSRNNLARDVLEDRDTIQTALHNASVLVRSLLNLGKPGASPVLSTVASSSSLTASNHDPSQLRTRTEYMNSLSNAMKKNIRIRYELNGSEIIQAILPALADSSTKECRAAAYRLLRHMIVDSETIGRLKEVNIDWYIIKTLAKDNKHAIEKEQAIKLIRAVVEIGSENGGQPTTVGFGSVPLSETVMRGIVAIAEQPEDPFKTICIQTLIEILLIDIDLMARCGGIRTLLHVLAECSADLTSMLSSAFLFILDSPRTRAYLSPGEDFEIVLSGVTDAYGKGTEFAERVRASTRTINSILRTWTGLLYFCIDDFAAIRSVIEVLRIPSLETREIVLDFFFELLNIKTPKWYQTFIDGRRLTMYRRSGHNLDKIEPASHRPQEGLQMRDQYMGLLLLVLTQAGLLDAITSMLEESASGTSLSRKAVLLMGEVMQLSNRLLPLHVAAQIQAAGRIFELASDQSSALHRIVGTNALSSLDSFNRHRTRLNPPSVKTIRLRANSVEDPVRRGQRQVEQVKIKIGMQMDERTFQAALLETNVMITKDHTKWNIDVLQDIIEGPLLNQKRMEEAIKVSRFMRKLMSFFHPFAHRYADVPRRGNARWVKLANTLLNTLMSSTEGQKFLLNEDPLVKDIVKGFAQLDPGCPSPPTDPLFSKRRVEETLSYSYIELLGTLSRLKEGIEILEKYKAFTAFYHLTELHNRQDLVMLIIEALDYSIDGHPRIVLSRALSCPYPVVRLFATNHLGNLVRRSSTPVPWMLRLLSTQMYDIDIGVCQLAVRFLEEVCEDVATLQMVVEMQPTFQHLGEMAHPLLMKAMSTSIGFRYLHDAGFIEREMENWLHERNELFAVQMEVFLAKAFSFTASERGDDKFEEQMPSHFYGEMAKTELGCAVLGEKGHFGDFARFIRDYGLEADDAELIVKLKSILWAVGNIGAAEGGLPFLEDEDVIPELIRVAEESPVLSVRGTCFFVLGLISSTIPGAEILVDFGWDATLSPLGLTTGICVPADLAKFTTIELWTAKTPTSDDRLIPLTDPREIELMTAIYNLSNTVIANTASRTLARMKLKPEYKDVFRSPTMLYRAIHIISRSKYKQPVRRYVLDLFDLQLNADTVTQLVSCEKQMHVHVVNGNGAAKLSRQTNPRVFSVIDMQVMHGDGMEGGDSDDDDAPAPLPLPRRMVRSLRPVSRIVGFAE